ncbi:MAG: hypothetical protein SFW63_06900 [Alphaproteobacteria bacterium]|nr:hypothetical protein [Alphaproteobacteria bacterium]
MAKKRKFHELNIELRDEVMDSITYPSDALTRGQIRALDIAFYKHRREKSRVDKNVSSDTPDWGSVIDYRTTDHSGYDRMTIDDLHREERDLVGSVMYDVSEGRYYRLDSPDYTKRLKDYYTRFGAFGVEQVDEKAIDAAIQSIVKQAKEKAKELGIDSEPVAEKPPAPLPSFAGRVRGFSEGEERMGDTAWRR